MCPRDLFLSIALAAMARTPSFSQSSSESARFGIIGGANMATITSSFIQNASTRTGIAAGLMAVLPVAPSFSIQPELMFTMKGANSKPGGTDGVAKINYVELPALARFETPASGRVKTFVYGGPGFAYRTNCMIEAHNAQIASYRADCDSLARQAAHASPGAKFSRTDVDGIIGGGLAFDIGGRTMTVSVRYDAGFVKLITYSDSKNRALSFMGTLEWPFRT